MVQSQQRRVMVSFGIVHLGLLIRPRQCARRPSQAGKIGPYVVLVVYTSFARGYFDIVMFGVLHFTSCSGIQDL